MLLLCYFMLLCRVVITSLCSVCSTVHCCWTPLLLPLDVMKCSSLVGMTLFCYVIDIVFVCCVVVCLLSYCICCRPGLVLKTKPKPRFWGKPNQNRKLKGFDRGSSRFWSGTRWTEGVAHSLNDAVFKLFLTGLLNDTQCNVGGRSGARGKVHCQRRMALITADHLVVIVHEEWGASTNLDVCCRCILIVVRPDTDRSFTQNLHFP